ncbi:hypothetical protein E3J79_01115 [Candidatus Dependentiae bacterium]|nr:MAG: hypothetical protein E3J79_01115 [Candidatus Dependentiae bacterium]
MDKEIMTTIERLPKKPGIYIFRNKEKQIIYIGKANSLRDRVRSYFSKERQQDLKIHTLIEEHESIDHITTEHKAEAALLEAHLIREHQPKYNVVFKSGQPFLYILFTDELLPKMLVVRNKKKKGVHFGPFLQKGSARAVHSFLTKTFRLNICNKKIESGCLAYHIGTCAGTCRSTFDHDNYLLRLSLTMDVLKGNNKAYIKKIEEKIKIYKKELAFEKAQHLHQYLKNFDTIFSALRLHFSPSKYAADIFVALNPFTDQIKQYSTPIDSRQKKKEGPHTEINESKSSIDVKLQRFLNLNKSIKTIDCFDISHFQSNALVGSCVRFTDGIPDKNKFRRFMIKTLSKQNDYAALQEIVMRRYKDKKELPDIILIDGGKGQLNAIAPLVPKTTCISLAKKEERLFGPMFPDGLCLDVTTEVGKLLIALRDYAHHFAISYHRTRSRKKLKEF